MRIISGIRRNVKNHGRCSIFVDGEFFAACPIDVALALGLKKGLEITDELERRLRSEDRKVVLRQKAYRFATYKPRTEHQIRKHLESIEAVPDEVDAIVAWLSEFRVVDDAGYVVRFLEASRERKPLSPAAARRTLLQRGIDKHVVDDALAMHFTDEETTDLALRVAEKKLRMLKPGTSDERQQQLIRFLQYRGYPWPVIKSVVDRLIVLMIVVVSAWAASSPNAVAQGTLSCERWRLPRNINDYQPTTQPVLGPDGAIYFDRKLHPLNEGGTQDPDDVWISRPRGQADWTDPARDVFTSVRRPDVLFNFTLDGLHALVVGTYATQGIDSVPCFAILHRSFVGDLFRQVEVISIPGITTLGRNFYGHLADDQQTLVLALERTDSRGELDLYVTHRCRSGWSDVVSLGESINTAGIEGAPWLSDDGQRLYFSSNGRDDRKGKSDLYVSTRVRGSWTTWSTPKNLGSCVNTVEDETSISLIGRGDSALITSWDAESGRSGVYLVVLDPEFRPSPTAVFTSRIVDAVTDSLITHAVVDVVDSLLPNSCPPRFTPDVKTGTVTLPLAQNRRYIITTSSPGYVPHRQVIGVHNLDSTVDLRLNTALFNTSTPLTSLYFERGVSTLDSTQRRQLREVIARYDLRQIRFSVMGYADALGTIPQNKTLSQERAEHVRVLLGELGIPQERIVASGRGIEQLSSVPYNEERPESRRVDVYPAP